MRTIGLIGGMSWESTMPHYRMINQTIKDHLGGLHSAKVILYSVDLQPIVELQHTGNWLEAGRQLAEVALLLQSAGAESIVLCTNTMHKVAPAIERVVNIPLLHVVDVTAEAIKKSNFKTVGLLGTRFTMEQDFYRKKFEIEHDISIVTPNETDRETVHQVIYQELCLGKTLDSSRTEYLRIIQRLIDNGAEAIILGCTEISMLVHQDDCFVPLFDTTALHAKYAAKWALSESY
ncbi:aspartate/glutamate racemase family protein [Aquirhabdus sp.]|uniref:aspartate/glutamate racemase family protein n=1 Tax=Aquirhabdus sp. TaxID=2824160 RepID=UPI00396CD044